MSARAVKWPEAQVRRFIDDWNAGMPSGLLRERYGLTNPSAFAGHLRDLGHDVRHRSPGAGFGAKTRRPR